MALLGRNGMDLMINSTTTSMDLAGVGSKRAFMFDWEGLHVET